MHLVPLNDEVVADKHYQEAPERGQDSLIVGELCVRLLELKDLRGPTWAASFINKLSALSSVHPEALWLTVRLMTGNLDELVVSYAELGKREGKSKQAFDQEQTRTLAAIERHFPQLTAAIVRLRHITAKIEDDAL